MGKLQLGLLAGDFFNVDGSARRFESELANFVCSYLARVMGTDASFAVGLSAQLSAPIKILWRKQYRWIDQRHRTKILLKRL